VIVLSREEIQGCLDCGTDVTIFLCYTNAVRFARRRRMVVEEETVKWAKP